MDVISLFGGFALNLVIAVLLVRFIYYPAQPDKNYVFTFLAFNTIIYFVMSFMATAELGLGVGFGLFAIFSVLRYRTSTMSTREMTYLFVVIALPVMNFLILRQADWLVLLPVNAAVLAVLFVLEREWGFQYTSAKSVRYERLDLLRPERHAELLADLRQRTGLALSRVEIGQIDFLNDSARLKLYYPEPKTHRRSLEPALIADDED
jgi:hypothetical protein